MLMLKMDGGHGHKHYHQVKCTTDNDNKVRTDLQSNREDEMNRKNKA